MSLDPVVELELIEGRPTVLGRDVYPGFMPSDVDTVSDAWGFATCSFAIRRPESAFTAAQADLAAWTPCKITEANKTLFEGRIQAAPVQPDENLIQVEGRGWQYVLDDDYLERMWVHARLSEFGDTRGGLTVDLAKWKTSGSVEVSDNVIVIGWAKGDQADANQHVGVTLDLGEDPNQRVARIVLQTQVVGPSAAFTFVVRGHDVEDPNYAGFEDVVTTVHNVLGTGPAATFATFRRFVTIFMYRSDGASGVTTGDNLVRITAARLFAATAYESGGLSTLKGSTVIGHVFDHAGDLSTDRSRIATSLLNLPHFATSDPRTRREVAEAINGLHGYRLKLTDGRLPIFEPFPTVPKWQVTPEAARRLSVSSEISGDPMFNVCLVDGNDEYGRPFRLRRYSAQLPEADIQPSTEITHPNPGFEVNVTGWDAIDGPFTRVTANQRSGSGAGRMESDSNNVAQVHTNDFAGTFRKGRSYRIRIWLRASTLDLTGAVDYPFLGTILTADEAFTVAPFRTYFVIGTYVAVDIWMKPVHDVTGIRYYLRCITSSPNTQAALIDDLEIHEAFFGLLDRRGQVRTHRQSIGFPVTRELGASIGDSFLRLHARAPFKAELPIQPGDLLTYPGGLVAHPRELQGEEGELIHFPGLLDPDTGRRGRDGILAQVGYRTEVARTSIDNERDNFEKLLERYALITGQQR